MHRIPLKCIKFEYYVWCLWGKGMNPLNLLHYFCHYIEYAMFHYSRKICWSGCHYAQIEIDYFDTKDD